MDREALERKKILNGYRRLLRKARPILESGDSKIIKKAFTVSLEAHKDMRRKSGEPYIMHPLAVAEICVEEIGLGTTSIVAALLHDVVEDSDKHNIQDIRKKFGEKVSYIIDGLTKVAGVGGSSTSLQMENFRKMLLTISDDLRVVLIKLADRLHNMRTLGSMKENQKLKISNETIYLYAPLAHRLGLYAIKSELEDLYLKHNHPKAYHDIVKKTEVSKPVQNRFIRNFIRPLKEKINELDISYEIKGRPKSVHSIWRKMEQQGVPFEEVFDLFAVRIIIDTSLLQEKPLCWHIYTIVTEIYTSNPKRLRDWVTIPKANGYESLHITVMGNNGKWVEVQIRTKRMDEIAEKGYAAHWKYKNKHKATEEFGIDNWINKVRDALTQEQGNAIEFIEEFRTNLYSNEVYVFTPKGELKTLLQHSTALDFAFEIHTEIGERCMGARVNNKLVPLNYELKNGDQIIILTSKRQNPNENWLDWVVTAKAKTTIKKSLFSKKKETIDRGKEIVKRKFEQLKVEYSNESLSTLVHHFKVSDANELFMSIGLEKIEHVEIKKAFDKSTSLSSYLGGLIKRKKTTSVTKKIEASELRFLSDGLEGVGYQMANCCKPIPGDNVFGFITVNEGIKIHRTTCQNAAELLSKYGYRITKAEWTSPSNKFYEISLNIIGTDRMGLLSDVTAIISEDLKINMRSLKLDSHGGIFKGSIDIYIEDSASFQNMLNKLKKVKGVVKVERTK